MTGPYHRTRPGQASPVQSVAGKTGAVTLSVADVAGAAPTANPAFSGAAATLPVGTSAERPASPAMGMVRGNSETGRLEFHAGGTWNEVTRRAGDVMTGGLGLVPGSPAAPAAYFADDPDTGLCANGANGLALVCGGSRPLVLAGAVGDVNGVVAAVAATGGVPVLRASGSDASVSLGVRCQGNGSIRFATQADGSNEVMRLASGSVSIGGVPGAESLRALAITSAVNYVQVAGAGTGGRPALTAQGADANVGLTIATKNVAHIFFLTGGATQFRVGYAANAVNYPQARGGASGSPALLEAVGSDANTTLRLVGQGTGGVQLEPAGGRVGFYGANPVAQAAVTGSRAGNAALASLISALAALGLVTDATTA